MSWFLRTRAIILGRAWGIVLCSFYVLSIILPVPEGGAARNTREVTVKYTGGSFAYAGSYALVIGISDYTGWPQLNGIKEDIKEVTKALEQHGFQVEVVRNPDLEELENAYRNFIRNYGRNEHNRLLFYFAGHAHDITRRYGETVGHLVAHDAPFPPWDHANFRDYTMSLGQFSNIAREIEAKHVLFLFDSCFSGARNFPLAIARPNDFERKVGQQTAEPVRQIISAGTADQQVPDKSFFRQVFVEALKKDSMADLNRDNYVTGSELGKFLQDRVPKYWRWQTPQYGKLPDPVLDRGDFVFDVSYLSSPPVVQPYPPKLPETYYNKRLNAEFVLIRAGEFTMGAKEGSPRPSPRVKISHPFYLSTTEVTQGQWMAVMGNNPSHFKGNRSLPVENVSWQEVQEFIRKLNTHDKPNTYRLPTEAEWEWAARAESMNAYSFGNDTEPLQQYAWCGENAGGRTQVVAALNPNKWGLYDMHGNVWEWCQDWYGEYATQSETDTEEVSTGAYRVYRGGGWRRGASELYCQVTSRHGGRPHFRDPALGFRLVMEVPTRSPDS